MVIPIGRVWVPVATPALSKTMSEDSGLIFLIVTVVVQAIVVGWLAYLIWRDGL